MCGITGIFTTQSLRADEMTRSVQRMAEQIAHRGPDDAGTWVQADAGIGLGFRRLSILDLSEHGHQPMVSASGRYVMVFNGEVYNYLELRRELEQAGCRFRGHSDTETVLAAFERWGVAVTVPRMVGMFAIALWDRELRTLTLVRDRLGKKPLYVFARSGVLLFGSELKAIAAGPGFDDTLNESAIAAYLQYLYIPAPDSVFQHVTKLLPGHTMTVRDPADPLPQSTPYWSALASAQRGATEPFAGSDADAIDALEALLADAVALRLQADVPVGALLSGGLDSSVVTALAQRASAAPLKTYTIAFDATEYNEAAAAARIARHLGTDHTELMLGGLDALELVPRLPDLFDEPLADPSQIPTYLVCALARRDVTVALSGDGGDETFGGYHRYIQGESIIRGMSRVPRPVRRALAAGIEMFGASSWDRAYQLFEPVLPGSWQHRLPGEKIVKLGRMMNSGTDGDMYRSLLEAWPAPGRSRPGSAVERTIRDTSGMHLLDRMMLTDQLTYLPDDLLAKVDRASMAVSLEVRVPLLDHRVVELAWRFRRTQRIRARQGKWALRQVLYRHVPKALVDRPKMGFTVPIAAWLRGPLRAWAWDLLSSDAARSSSAAVHVGVQRARRAIMRNEVENANGVWAVLMLLAWRRRWITRIRIGDSE
jgi:asparagine synthase (glutamine-hydrolysing)